MHVMMRGVPDNMVSELAKIRVFQGPPTLVRLNRWSSCCNSSIDVPVTVMAHD